MNRSRARHGDRRQEVLTDFDPNERFDRLERMVAALHPKMNSLLRASDQSFFMELDQMANFQELADNVAKIKGTVASTKAFIQGLKTKLEEAAAGMNDTEDQAAIVALSAELSGAETELTAAITANPEPPTGASMRDVTV